MAKPKKNSFEDVKMLIATLSISMTLVFWHLFSASDVSAEEQVAVANIPQASATVELVAITNEPTPTFTGKILLGGKAPQPQVIVQRINPSGNNNVSNNGSSGAVTQTKSS